MSFFVEPDRISVGLSQKGHPSSEQKGHPNSEDHFEWAQEAKYAQKYDRLC